MYEVARLPEISNIIPRERDITREEIENFTDEDVDLLKTYIVYFYERDIDLKTLDCFLSTAFGCLNNIPDGNVVLCPGDSPAKIVKLIDLIYKGEGGTIRFSSILLKKRGLDIRDLSEKDIDRYKSMYHDFYEDYEYVVDGISYKKTLKFVSFALSGIQEDKNYRKLNDELKLIFGWYDVHDLEDIKFTFMDHIESGETLTAILKSIRKLSDTDNMCFHVVNMAKFWSKCGLEINTYSNLISDSERSGSRCTQKRKIGAERKPINMTNCNVIVTVAYLRYLGRLETLPTVNDLIYPNAREEDVRLDEFYKETRKAWKEDY